MGWGLAALAVAAVAALAAAVLLAMGRPPICTCGQVLLWYGDINGPGNSQHIADWYTPTHLVHGMVFFVLLLPLSPWAGLPARALVAVLLEAAWEILENTPWVIERYRSQTLGIGYAGDSVLNSMSDIAVMLAGFLLAARLGLWRTLLLAAAIEVALALVIRDNLTLNLIMLIHPLPAIKAWQTGV